jgi:hypothetical protein
MSAHEVQVLERKNDRGNYPPPTCICKESNTQEHEGSLVKQNIASHLVSPKVHYSQCKRTQDVLFK